MRSNVSSHSSTSSRQWRLRVCGLLVGAVALTLLPASPAMAGPTVFVIDATGGCAHHCFEPESVTTTVGDPVTWLSQSVEGHDITRCSFGPCPHDGGTGAGPFPSKELAPEEAWSHTFTAPGTYNYYCAVHGYNDMHGFITVEGEPAPTTPPPGDFDGDGKTDLGLFRPSAGTWYVDGSSGTDSAAPFGTSGDLTVSGDYDGDGDSEFAVFRPSTGIWYVNGGPAAAFGTSGDIPVPGDYDGDGDTEFAVFRPSTGIWYVNGGAAALFGASGDIPVPGDYDGDGDTDFAVFRPSTGIWYVHNGPAAVFGTSGDIPVPGDYDGDGDTDFAVFRPSTGIWYVHNGPAAVFGTSGDIPVPGDYDGDGDTDFAVFRPSTGIWYVNGGAATLFGTSGDIPVPLPTAIRQFFFA